MVTSIIGIACIIVISAGIYGETQRYMAGSKRFSPFWLVFNILVLILWITIFISNIV